MMTLRYYVQAIPQRAAYVQYLQQRLPNCTVHWDTQRNATLAFQELLALPGSEAAVFVEDDALLCQNFAEEAERRILLYPEAVHSFIFLKLDNDPFFAPDRLSDYDGVLWDRPRRFVGTQGWYAPAGFAAELSSMIAEGRRNEGEFIPTLAKFKQRTMRQRHPDNLPQDLLVSYFLYGRKERFAHWFPGLVNHREGQSFMNAAIWEGRLRPPTPYFLDSSPWHGKCRIP